MAKADRKTVFFNECFCMGNSSVPVMFHEQRTFRFINRQCPVSPGRARYFLAMRQESTQRSAPSSPPAAPVPSLQAFPAAGPDRESRAGLPRRKYFLLSGSEGKKDSSAVRPSPQPSPAGRGRQPNGTPTLATKTEYRLLVYARYRLNK